MTEDFGNNRNQATPIFIRNIPQVLKNTIGGSDRADFLRIKLSTRSQLHSRLSYQQANTDLTLLNPVGEVVEVSKRRGKSRKTIDIPLDTGVYFLKITPRHPQKSTQYQLRLWAMPTTAPVLAINRSSSLNKGEQITFSHSLLNATGIDQNPSQLVYTLTRLPQAGFLELGGDRLRVGNSFTQADIDAGRLAYSSLSNQSLIRGPSNFFGGTPAVSISDFNVTWTRGDYGADNPVFLFDGAAITQLSTDQNQGRSPRISGSNVVWYGKGGSDGGTDTEIFFYNGSTVTQLTTNQTNDDMPQISGSHIVWSGQGGSDGGTDREIFFYNGSTITQLTTNRDEDFAPQISGSNVVWAGVGGSDRGSDSEIFFYNGAAVSQLTRNKTDDNDLQISGANVVWSGRGGSDRGTDSEIFFYNGATVSQLTHNKTDDSYPQISGANVVWSGKGGKDSGTDSEVFFYNGAAVSQLTRNKTDDYASGISDTNVIWRGQGGSDRHTTDTEIFFYNGSTTQVTADARDAESAVISGANIAWKQATGYPETDTLFFNNLLQRDSFDFTVTDRGGRTKGTFKLNLT